MGSRKGKIVDEFRNSEWYRLLFESAGDALFIESEKDKILDANQRACELLGYSREELMSMTVRDLQAPESRGVAGHVLETEIATHRGRPFEALDRHRDGTIIPVEVTNTRMEDSGLYLSIVRDISDRVAADSRRRAANEILEDSSAIGFSWRNDEGWNVDFVTENVDRVFGYSAEDFSESRIMYADVVHPDDLERVADEVRSHVADTECREFTHEPYRIVARDGTVRWLNDHTSIARDPDGSVTHLRGIVVDITPRMEAVQAVRESEEKLETFFELNPDPIVISSQADGTIMDVNGSFTRATGYSKDEVIGRSVFELGIWVHPEERDEYVQALSDHGRVNGLVQQFRIKDGSARTGSVSGALIRIEDQPCILGTIRDITEQLRLENEVAKMERIQSLGVLAGGIAHDFNNFLTGIIGNLELARMEIPDGHPVVQSLNEMRRAAIRAKELTQQLLTFSKGGDPVRKVTDIAGLVREATGFALRGSNVTGEVRTAEGLRSANVDAAQISQVLQNLLINADQAMPDGGTVIVEAINEDIAADNSLALAPGPYVSISVQDRGPGISPDNLNRVFDPYFTTKSTGNGLGLAVAYSIAEKHAGKLTVDTLPKGTRFTLFLPASGGMPDADADAQINPEAGAGKILVMDDEDFIRTAASTILSRLGYEVETATGGEDAVNRYREAHANGRAHDVVILDLTVRGGMGGAEAVQRLRDINPSVAAVVSSGYSNDPVMSNHRQYGFAAAVQKPYTTHELAEGVRAVMEENA
jgi:two-component system cell cycle sensor histidine kinase/response regulator CckA